MLQILSILAVVFLASQAEGAHTGFYRGIGEPCLQKSYWETTRRGTCDELRGFSCQNYPEYGGWVCACSTPFAYDPHSNECRRALNNHCQHMSLNRLREAGWYDKCQQNAECGLSTSASGKPVGRCMCKSGFQLSYGADFCER